MTTHLVRVSVLVLGGAAAWAQNANPLKADVPFDFSASGVTMPAGRYLVTQHAFSGFITLHGEDTGKNLTVPTLTAKSGSVPVTARPSKNACWRASTRHPAALYSRRSNASLQALMSLTV